ncbi:MAG: hypothetical protein CM1200mP7_0480 [Chloroflexota bacterium]|nr:MAG: hypothetical protein CM1200mP7_0480 [Chloroflexota bacterium]
MISDDAKNSTEAIQQVLKIFLRQKPTRNFWPLWAKNPNNLIY